MSVVQEAITRDAVRDELARVFSRGEFQQQKSLLEDMLERVLPRIGSEELSAVGDVLTWILVVALCAVLLVLIQRWVRALRARDAADEGPVQSVLPDLEARLEALVARARAARARGDLRLALRLFFLALLLALGGRGDLEYRDAWTNREILRRGRPSLEARALLESLLRELEAKEFGRAAVDASDVERLEALLAARRGDGAGSSA